jgi:hypothetical protein
MVRLRSQLQLVARECDSKYSSKHPYEFLGISKNQHAIINHVCMYSLCKIQVYETNFVVARFEVYTAVLQRRQVSCYVILCRWVSISGRIKGTCCLHLQGLRLLRRMPKPEYTW